MGVPYYFENQIGTIPLSQLDANFAALENTTNINYTAPFTNAVQETLTNKLAQTVSVLDFGADPTGTTDSTAAIQAAHNASVANNFFDVYFPTGTYLLNSGLTWSPFVCPKSGGDVVFNFSAASGTLFTLSSDYGQPTITISSNGAIDSERSLFNSNFIFNATNPTNTCKAFFVGTLTTTKATRFINIVGATTNNFASCVEFGNHTYLITFTNCNFLGNYDSTRIFSCNGIFQSVANTITDSGENIVFNNCTFQHLNNAIINNNLYGSNALEIKFNDCSFDQCLQIVGDDISVDKYEFNNCHLEGSGTTTQIYCSGNAAQTSGDMIILNGGLWYLPQSITPANPALAIVKNYGRLTIRNIIHSLGSPTSSVVSVDANSQLNREDRPRYALFSYIPTIYQTNATPVNLIASATCQTVTYTPTFTSDTGSPNLGSSTISGEYYRIGNRINVRIKLLITTGGSWNTGSGTWHFGLPSGIPLDNTGLDALGTCFINKYGTGEFVGIARITGTGATTVQCYTTASFPAIVGASYPSPWVTNDYVEMDITYTTTPT
jgi:hypothetical protein